MLKGYRGYKYDNLETFFWSQHKGCNAIISLIRKSKDYVSGKYQYKVLSTNNISE